MAGITIPRDRTTRQPVRGYCLNPACLEDSADSRYEFCVEHDKFACPKCGCDTPPRVGVLVLTHLLMDDPQGRIRGSGGARYRMACDPKRAHLATESNLEAATGDAYVANCPGCLVEYERLRAPALRGYAFFSKQE